MLGKHTLSTGAVALLIFISVANASWLTPAPKQRPVKIAARAGMGSNCADMQNIWRAAARAEGPAQIEAEPEAGCPTLQEMLQASGDTPFIVHMASGPATLAAFDAAKVPVGITHGFVGDSASVTAIRARAPNAWAWTWAEARQCQSDYALWGWFTTVPESCKGKTMLVRLDEQWRMPGWPRRAMKRLKEAGTRVLLAADTNASGDPVGIATIAHMENVPVDYDGHLWIDDIDTISRLVME